MISFKEQDEERGEAHHNTIRKKKIIALKTDLQHENTWL